MAQRYILHLDADAFFASVEQVLNPRLKGKPVIVGGAGRAGIVASCSYEARKYGIHSGLPGFQARKLCPQAIFIHPRPKVYHDFSERMFRIFEKYTPQVEATSIDEGYLDLTGITFLPRPILGYPALPTRLPSGRQVGYQKAGLGGADQAEQKSREKWTSVHPREIAQAILKEVEQTLRITVSAGLSSNKTVSKIASDLFKPNRLTFVPPGQEKEFLAPLPLEKLPGVGPRTLAFLKKEGLEKIGDLARTPLSKIKHLLGVNGISLWEKAQGIDHSSVISETVPPKSISKEHTFDRDLGFNEISIIEQTLRSLLNRILFKLRREKLEGRTLFLKIRYADFSTITFQKTLNFSSALETDFFPLGKQLLKEKLSPQKKIRLLGVGVTNLIQGTQLNLFEFEREKKRRLATQIDRLREKYGMDIFA